MTLGSYLVLSQRFTVALKFFTQWGTKQVFSYYWWAVLVHHQCVEVCRAQSPSDLLKLNCGAEQLEIQNYNLSTWVLFSPFALEEESISLVIRDGNSVSQEELGSLARSSPALV